MSEYEDNADTIIDDFDRLLLNFNHMVTSNLQMEEKFRSYVQHSINSRERLSEALLEKQRLEIAVADIEKERIIKLNKLNVAQNVVQREQKLRERASNECEAIKSELNQLLVSLAEQKAKEIRAKLAARLNEITPTTNTDIDITSDSTFFSSVLPSSGVESDISSTTSQVSHKNPFKSTGFTPVKVSSLRESTADLLTADNTFSITASSILSNSSRRSAVFYAAIIENLKNRPHRFTSKIFTLGQQCVVCEIKVSCGKRALACQQCKCVSHEKCSQNVSKPCIPLFAAGSIHSKAEKSIRDYVPPVAPHVPAIVVHCVLEIEKRGLDTAGLYKVPTFDHTVDELKHQICKNRGIPNLSRVNVLDICQFLKDFFGSLKPALVPQHLFASLLNTFEKVSAENITFEMLFNVMDGFMASGRDTFVFLVLHLQNVANSKGAEMPGRRLSKVFTPLLVEGYKKELFKEERRKCKVLEKFIELPSEYWKIIFVKDM